MNASRALKKYANSGNNNNNQEPSERALFEDDDNDNAELRDIADSVIGEDYLRRVSGKSDLTKVEFIQLRVDLSIQSVLDICDFVPHLQSLVLDDSVISSVRDLGTGLRCLISLSLNSCALNDLDGIGVLTGLQDLSVSDNFIVDASPLVMHENLATLNLSGNNISNISVADELNSCPNLRSLFMGRNPIEKAPQYRLVVSSLITSLERLDGSPVNREAASRVTNNMVLEAADVLRLEEEEADEERRIAVELDAGMIKEANGGSNGKGKEQNGNSPRKGNSGGGGTVPDTGSELTHGSTVVLAGNMAAAMRRRRNNNNEDTNANSREGSANGNREVNSDQNHSSISRNSSQGSRRNSAQEEHENVYGKDALSTIDLLDQALTTEGSSAQNKDFNSIRFLGEGDITNMMTNNGNGDYDNNTEDSETQGMMPEYAESPRNSPRAQHQNRSNKRGQVVDSYSSFAADADSGGIEELTMVGSRGSQRGANTTIAGAGARGQRPSSALAGSSMARNSGSWVAEGEGRSMSQIAQQLDAGSSPPSGTRGRPQTQNTQRSTMRSAPSAPFKVVADADDLKAFKNKIHVNPKHAEDHLSERAPVWSVGRTHTGHRSDGSDKISKEQQQGGLRKDTEEVNANNMADYHGGQDDVITNGVDSGYRSQSALLAEQKRLGPTKSYIHKDMVMRSSRANDGQEDEYDEDISVSAAARHKMMEQSGRQKTPRAGVDDGDSETEIDQSPEKQLEQFKKNKNQNNQNSLNVKETTAKTGNAASAFPEKGIASMVGVSLGFNLQESLAAIDQWVEEMDSDSDSAGGMGYSSEESDGEGDVMNLSQRSMITSYAEATPTKTPTASASASRSRISNIEETNTSSPAMLSENFDFGGGSYSSEKIGGGVGGDADTGYRYSPPNAGKSTNNANKAEGNQEQVSGLPVLAAKPHPSIRPRSRSSSRTGSAGSNRSGSTGGETHRILSRDAIFSMCSGGERLEVMDETDQAAQQRQSSISGMGMDNHKPVSTSVNVHKQSKPLPLPGSGLGSGHKKEEEREGPKSVQSETGPGPLKGSVAVEGVKGVAKASPPRHEGDEQYDNKQLVVNKGSLLGLGEGARMSDVDLVIMLKRPPKATPALRTKSSYQDFFRGIEADRMRRLLEEAYEDLGGDGVEKVEKRLKMLFPE